MLTRAEGQRGAERQQQDISMPRGEQRGQPRRGGAGLGVGVVGERGAAARDRGRAAGQGRAATPGTASSDKSAPGRLRAGAALQRQGVREMWKCATPPAVTPM